MSMDKVSFQNGFIAGMATKGLVRSGEQYKPLCWNDSGVYDYFYIDFKRQMHAFSLGMFNESIIVHDSQQLAVTGVELVANGTYKVYCNINGKINGVTVINKKTSLLSFINDRVLPVFSTMFYVKGLDTYVRKAYAYDTAVLDDYPLPSVSETPDCAYWALTAKASSSETADFPGIALTASDNIDVSYWSV